MERNALSASDIDWLVPHQANLRIVETDWRTAWHAHAERVLITLPKYGNTSAATIPLALWDYETRT